METLGNDGVKELAEELEPFVHGDSAITIGVESGEELLDFLLALGGVSIGGESDTLAGKLLDLILVDETVGVEIET